MIYSSSRGLGGVFLCSAFLLSACGGGSDSAPPMYSVGGTIAGLASGASVVLQNDAGNNTSVATNGTFTFSKQATGGTSYAVSVLTQPTGQSCTVTSGSGTVSRANVTSVQVICVSVYTISGTVSGLNTGAQVTVQNNAGDSTTVVANGNFSFSKQATSGATYAVTILTQPTGQTCTVTSGSGTVSETNVTSVQVTCATNTYTISGTVSGLNTGAQVTLQDNAAGLATVKANGSFSFGTPILYNGSYAVSVAIQPPAQACTVTGGTGTGVTSNVSNVTVTCVPATESVIYSFDANPDGVDPRSNAIQGSDGNFYGTTYSGGASGLGTVFKITPAGVETVLHSFAGGTADGSNPSAALVQGSDGNFYGTTYTGGASGLGTVFKITLAGAETVLHSFAGAPVDGSGPLAALVQGSDGSLYGTTLVGGTGNQGTVFKITPTGAETVLHSFAGNTVDGGYPYAALLQGSDGNFYGTASNAGPGGGGIVFMITPAGAESLLHSFTSFNRDSSNPTAALIQASDGNFYGTSDTGGANNAGTIFKITPTGVETLIYSFVGGVSDGQGPFAALVQGKDGNFYGTTHQGGANDEGTMFKITPAGAETLLHSFTGGSDGSLPLSSLIQASDGNLYGTTENSGASLSGSFVMFTLTGTETTVYSFNSGTEGQKPVGLIQANDGNFYGTTNQGGATGNGTVFKITPAGVESVLHSFAGGTTDGGQPQAALLQGSDGNFYGTTAKGGASGNGTVFKITPNGVESVLYSFAGGATDGAQPEAALIQASDGNFYGTTNQGGANGFGTVFRISLAGVESVLHSFAGSATDGSSPQAALLQASDGNFYGTTNQGGLNGFGTVFMITPAGVETVLHSFSFSTGDGNGPRAALIQGRDGSFYGTTFNGGGIGIGTGTVFKISATDGESVVHAFGGGTDGSGPNTALIQGSDGNLYGTTSSGGPNNYGTLFEITSAGVESVLYPFAGGTTDGSNPNAVLILGSDGNFYGTTQIGGMGGQGTIFKF
jgi:uncharacterized repeat protein (TIGR03803 family)